MTFDMMVQHFFNALMLGSLYGLIAIGYTMVYGILRLINFAHGDIFMISTYFVFLAITAMHLPWIPAVLLSILATAIFGVMIDRVAYQPLRNAPRISALISAIGVSFFIENLCLVIFTGVPKPMPRFEPLVRVMTLGNVRILPLAIFVPIISFILVGALLWMLYRTKPGLAMRAISRDIETTRLMGVKVDRIIALTFAIGSALAACAGIMWALRYPQIHPFMGVFPGLKAFIAAVLGGIGSVQGAMIGGLLLGFMEIMLVAFFPALSGYRDAFAFVLLILILFYKPTGLMGEKLEDKI
ncbi:branched-chain amino acid ABC transporter permease [Cloacibacillus porcorum]|uniref:branched-chain amino acid ABC transporter permease n=1 Tax=Cloacibacillus porcorum TaxID=1197717 RepID=UPI0014592DAA|nr:branched-chain amino acid ABC transporter permease [Cloacibacillus porcorum]MCC8183442.1 branched-chain amino acid ABC transporter permease [Cloacibacillus porcorum]MCI5865910.1 branched-chain amino acid ABC transporter permease [Cloacibacillus porcorum]MDY5390751.1 branched-chain amino acid ABC transporter permease [Cloacibacillus porcorum]NMF19134.1 branched-chain amino acid ABC transporter permease [Cloacibacillus porcorum]